MQNLQQTADSTALRPAQRESSVTYSDLTWISQRIQAGELSKPGPELDDFTRKLLVGLWLETLQEIGAEAFDAAFKQVLRSSTFRPDIAEIRKAAGINRGIQDPTEAKAMSALKLIFAIMRVHGPEMEPIKGRILNDGKDEHGERLFVPLRAPSTPAPALAERTEAALYEMGFGSRAAGLEMIACHPAICKSEDPRFRAKRALEIEQRWIQVFAEVR